MVIMNRRRFLAWVIVLATGLFLYLIKSRQVDDIWLGQVLTMADEMPTAQALAVRNGQIIALGSADEVLPLAGWGTRVHPLDDQILMPGFVAAHEHPAISAVFRGLVDLSALTNENPQQAVLKLQQAIAHAEPGEWIFATGIDPILMPEMVMLRDQLDELAPNNPVLMISQFLHTFWVNSAALNDRGINAETLSAELAPFYDRYPDGRLNGTLHESHAAEPFIKPLRAPLAMIGKLRQQLNEYSAAGITTVASLGFNAPPWLSRWVARRWQGPMIRQVLYLAENELSYLPNSPENGNAFFRIAGLKLWYDGSPYAGSMYLTQPYLQSTLTHQLGLGHAHRGHALLTEYVFRERFRQFDAEGWQIAIHSQGDAATAQVLDFIASSPPSQQARRHRLEHGLLLPVERLPDIANLNLSISYHINHLWYYGDALADQLLGQERSQTMLPLQSTLNAGVKISLHADSPMFPAQPFSLMQSAMVRKSRSGRVFGAPEQINATAALRSMTIEAAWQLGMDHLVGSLEVGKRADLITLSANPLTTPAEEWRDIQVESVWVDGQQVQ